MNRRLRLLRHTLARGAFGGSFRSWVLSCFGPPAGILARGMIETVGEEGGFRKIVLRGREGGLYFSKAVPPEALYVPLVEQLCGWHWHCYQVPQTRVTPEDTVLDCGCAEGIFSFLVGPTAKRVFAFEPVPEYLEGLEMTFRGSRNVTIVPQALSDTPGQAFLQRNGMASSITGEATGTGIAVNTIDAFCAAGNVAPSYIKADLEGHEVKMLAGAAETIRQYRPKIAITTYHDRTHPALLADFLKRVVPTYRFLFKGIEERHGGPMMLHAWSG